MRGLSIAAVDAGITMNIDHLASSIGHRVETRTARSVQAGDFKTSDNFIIDVDGQIGRYAHGPLIPMTVQWPGPRGTSQVRVQVAAKNSATSGMVTDGAWALFRLFDRTRNEPGGSPERFRATFEIDGRKAVFDITSSSVRNAFVLNELKEFSCPSTL